jgi:hypothetical protein
MLTMCSSGTEHAQHESLEIVLGKGQWPSA